MGKYDNNPYRNSIDYEVEFADGEIREYMANLIAEGMLAQVDTDGKSPTVDGRDSRLEARRLRGHT